MQHDRDHLGRQDVNATATPTSNRVALPPILGSRTIKLGRTKMTAALLPLALGVAAIVAGLGVLLVPDGAANAATNQQITNRTADISFYVPAGFVHQKAPRYIEVDEYNSGIGVEIQIESAAGEVSVADERSDLSSWLGNSDLTFGAAKYLHESYGRVAYLPFSIQPNSVRFRIYGRDLRFIDGTHSFDVVVDSPNPSATVRTVNLLLQTWGT